MEESGICLVTGAAGFIGSHLVDHLIESGARVRASAPAWEDLTDLRQREARGEIELVTADVTRPETLPALFEGNVDRIFHLGAICNLSTPYSALKAVNVDGVGTMSALALSTGVRCFVYMGSTSVYASKGGAALEEDTERVPTNSYGRSKRDAEDLLQARSREGLGVIILRPCTVYGPGCTDGAGKVFSRQSSIAAIPGNGRQRLSNVRVEDVAAAAVYLAQREEALGQAFNIADDSHPSLEEALTLAAEVFGGKQPSLHLPIALLEIFARVQGFSARLQGRIPDLELDALAYLRNDYLVENRKLKASGYRLRYPDFAESIRELGRGQTQ
ncbi:MAG: NAD-dependent epimerase/dehydratase family protein [bacterium]|nr:NAD-dependent epimerase/dehydratase family protein [bacterium]